MVRKYFVYFVFLHSALWGLGFSAMGNVSTSLGGAGVALRNSAWGLYYNPALLASDPRSKFSFSAGAWIAKNNINPLLKIDIQTDPTEVSNILASLKDSRLTLNTQMGVVTQVGEFRIRKQVVSPDENGILKSHTVQKELSAFALGAFAISQTQYGIQSTGGSAYNVRGFGMALMEIPVGYGYKLETSFGDFNFGIALKYMRAVFDFSSYGGDAYGGLNLEFPNFLQMTPVQNFGIDLGFLYSFGGFHAGLSAKNINLPSFETKGKRIRLEPSLRAGFAYEFLKHYTFALDVDLLPQGLSNLIAKSHYLGFGIIGDYTSFDFRLGFATDFLNFSDSKITAGFNVFGILDLVGEMGFNFVKEGGSELAIPTNFGFKIGSTFTF